MTTPEADWDQIADATGLSDQVLAKIQANWERPVQTWEEVEAGVQFERQNRLAESDKPGGLTDQLKSSVKE